jgi:hypothetical protein
MGFYEQDVAIPCISGRACRQPSKHIHSIDLKDISLMVNITRLKHQKGGFAWINTWAIEREVLCRSCEWNVGFDIVKGAWFITKVLSLE